MTRRSAEEDEEQRLIDEAVRHRIQMAQPRRAEGRRASDGWHIRASDLSMLGALAVLILPLFGMVFYVRDIAGNVTVVVARQAVDGKRIDTLEDKYQALRDDLVRINTGASERARELYSDHEQRIRVLEGRK